MKAAFLTGALVAAGALTLLLLVPITPAASNRTQGEPFVGRTLHASAVLHKRAALEGFPGTPGGRLPLGRPAKPGAQPSWGDWGPAAAEACSEGFRRSTAAGVLAGALPPLLLRSCNRTMMHAAAFETARGGKAAARERLQSCRPEALERLAAAFRHTRQQRGFLEMVPCDLVKALAGRTLWLLGDSQMESFYRQLQCFLEPLVPEGEALDTKPRPGAMGRCTLLAGGARVCLITQTRGERQVSHVLPDLDPDRGARGARASDYLLLNFGLWHAKNDAGEQAYPAVVWRLAEYYLANRTRLPTLLFLSTGPQFFRTRTGEYPRGNSTLAELVLGPPEKRSCAPLEGARLQDDGTLAGDNADVLRGGWRNAIARPVLHGEAGIPWVDVWNETLGAHDLVRGGPDCTHSCLPGPYAVWAFKVWQALAALQVAPAQEGTAAEQ